MTSLINDLGGAAGFGEFSLARNDDGSTAFIDLSSIFGAQGINFFGQYYTGLWLNNNGSVTFSAPVSAFTPSAITGSTSNPIIAAYWADVDTRGGAVAPTPGGTSTGTNLLWYDLDSTTRTFTATWDDVGYYSSQTNKLNAFQLSIREINEQGDFDIVFRYENVDWTTGGASGGSNGLGGTPARAGYSSGNGVEYFELPQSGDQAALLALESASNVGTPGTFIFQVRNGVPTVGISAGDESDTEGNGGDPRTLVIPVFLTEPSSSTVTVHYTTADGTALAGQDYVAQSGILTFAPGVTRQDIVVELIGDAVVEDDETFTITLSDPSGGALLLDGSATATIVNDDTNDTAATLSIAATGADKAEGNEGATTYSFTVTRTGDTSGATSANWAVAGAAVNATDFVDGVLPSGTVTFAPDETSKVIEVAVAGDTVVEANEAFTVTLSDPSVGAIIGTASADGVIRNDDATLSIAATSADKTEGNTGSTTFSFTVTRAGDTSGSASANWTVAGPAINGADFVGGTLPFGIVSFAAGETSKIIEVAVTGDTVVEADEAFTVTLSDPSAGVTIGTTSADGVIRNNDATLSITATSADKAEDDAGATTFAFTVTRAGDTSGPASAHWVVTGAAVDGADFVGGVLPSGTVSFTAGETSKVIEVAVVGDTVVEANEAFTVTLSDPSVGAVIGTASADGVIRNDDASLSIAATDADKPEGNVGATAFTFVVTRGGDTSGPASADWAVIGSAVTGSDFLPSDDLLPYAGVYSYFATLLEAIEPGFSSQANLYTYLASLYEGFPQVSYQPNDLPSGTVSFAAGETSKEVTIWILGEMVMEQNESFSVTLSNADAGAVIYGASAAGTIRNDDGEVANSAPVSVYDWLYG